MEHMIPIATKKVTQLTSNGSETKKNNGDKNRQQYNLSPRSIDLIFRTFSRRYTYRWDKNFKDYAARSLWMRDLASAGITDEMVIYGLNKSVECEWPPSVGEFVKLCKPEAVTPCHRAYKGLPAPKASKDTGKKAIEAMRKTLGQHK